MSPPPRVPYTSGDRTWHSTSFDRLPGESHDEQCERLWGEDVKKIQELLPSAHIRCSTQRRDRNADKICIAPRYDHLAPIFDPKCAKQRRRGPWDMCDRTVLEAEIDGWLMHFTEAGCGGTAARFVLWLRRRGAA
jgi:hypothetical protein